MLLCHGVERNRNLERSVHKPVDILLCRCSSGDSTARLWKLTDSGSHDLPIVLPHEPVGRASQECNRDVTTVHWNVSEPRPPAG